MRSWLQNQTVIDPSMWLFPITQAKISKITLHTITKFCRFLYNQLNSTWKYLISATFRVDCTKLFSISLNRLLHSESLFLWSIKSFVREKLLHKCFCLQFISLFTNINLITWLYKWKNVIGYWKVKVQNDYRNP